MRPIWSGAVSFGLVNIPVRLYSATEDKGGLSFHYLHKTDESPIRYAKMCKAEDVEVPFGEIVRGYEYEKGNYVIVDEEDFERASPKKTKSVEILDFANADEIDPMYYDKPYFLEPDRGADKPYALLREALKHSNKVGVAKFVLRNRENLAALRAVDDVIILNQLRFDSEVRKPDELKLPEMKLDDREMTLATSLIDQLTQDFNPAAYQDTYTEELKRTIEEKVEGKEPTTRDEEPAPTEVRDLIKILKASLDQERAKKVA